MAPVGPDYTITTLPLDQIDGDDRTYCITDRETDLPLVKSLKAVGLLNPPLLAFPPNQSSSTEYAASPWIVVCGFRRIAAARSLEWPAITVRLLPAEATPLECARYAIGDNTSQRSLNLLEQARAYGLLERMAKPHEVPTVAAALGLPDNRSFIRKLADLRKMPRSLQKAVRDETIPLAIALQLQQLAPDDALAMAGWFIDLQLNLNQQRQMLTYVTEIGKREDLAPATVLEEPKLEAIVSQEGAQIPQVRQLALAHLYHRRFPTIADAEAEFAKLVKSLKLGSRMRLVPPKHFEAADCNLGIRFSSMEELQQTVKRLAEMLNHSALQRICTRFLGDNPR